MDGNDTFDFGGSAAAHGEHLMYRNRGKYFDGSSIYLELSPYELTASHESWYFSVWISPFSGTSEWPIFQIAHEAGNS